VSGHEELYKEKGVKEGAKKVFWTSTRTDLAIKKSEGSIEQIGQGGG